MRIIYDEAVDILRLLLVDSPIEESDEVKPGMIIDYNKAGQIVALELLDASRTITNPREVTFGFAELK